MTNVQRIILPGNILKEIFLYELSALQQDSPMHLTLSEALNVLSMYQLIYYNNNKIQGITNPYPLADDVLYRQILKIIGQRAPDVATAISKYSGYFQCMYNDITHADDYWAYYLINGEKNTLNILDIDGTVVKTFNYARVGYISSNYIMIEDNPFTEIFKPSPDLKEIEEIGRIRVLPSKYEVLSETIEGPMAVIDDIEGNQVHYLVYTFGKEGKKRITMNSETQGIGYLGYYANNSFYHPYPKGYTNERFGEDKNPPVANVVVKGISEELEDQLKSLKYTVECTNTYGVSIFNFRNPADIRLFCRNENNDGAVFNVLWTSKDEHQMIIDGLVVYGDRIVDIITGSILYNLSCYSANRDIRSIINGVTRKADGTGYYIWLDKRILALEVQWEIYKSFKEPVKFSESSVPLPDMYVSIVADRYYDLARTYAPAYVIGNEFPVYSRYSLYPYFHFLMTGKPILVIALTSYNKNILTVIGYNNTYHRVFKEYQLYKVGGIITNVYEDFDGTFFTINNANERGLVIQWIENFIANHIYIDANREDKVSMIQEYAQKHRLAQ